MHQFISRPAVYLVIGIGVLALLVSQFRSTDNQAATSVSELDPFSSLENISGRNLAKSTPDWEALAPPTSINPVEMVRDEMTSSHSFQQTPAAMLNSVASEAQTFAGSADVEALDSTLQFGEIDIVEPQVQAEPQLQVEAQDPVETQVRAIDQEAIIDQINEADDSLTVLELDEPIVIDSEVSNERYLLDEVVMDVDETSDASVDPIEVNEEPQTVAQPSTEFKNMRARVKNAKSMRPKGWRKNPFINDRNDVTEAKPASEALEIETSSNATVPGLSTDSFNMESIISTEMSEVDQVATVGNFEPENASSAVSTIPSAVQPMQTVVSAGHQYQESSLPIVIGLPDSVAHKAVHNIEYGKSLSRRGSSFSARQEFYSSLRILAQAHDTQAGGTAYTRALRDAIIALKEAEDFIVSDTETQIGLNVDAVVEGHATKLIPAHEATSMTAIGAMQRYFSFASSQLRVACGQNPVAAEALYCLGKLHTVQAKFGANASKLDIAKSIVFHQAAIASDRTNFRSANELGVLMANSGRLQESQDMLKRSLQIQQLPQAWQNLAVVHQRSGQDQLAQLAQQEFLISSSQQATAMAQNTIRWMNPEKFNQGTPLELRQPRQAQQPLPQGNTSKPTISQRIKSLF